MSQIHRIFTHIQLYTWIWFNKADIQISQKRDLPIDAAPEKPCMWHLFQQASGIYACKESTSDIPGSDKSMRKTAIQLKLLVKLHLIFASEQIHNSWDYHSPDLNRHKTTENSGPVQCTSLTWRPKFGPGYQNSLIWFSNQLLLRRTPLPLTGKIILHGSCYQPLTYLLFHSLHFTSWVDRQNWTLSFMLK